MSRAVRMAGVVVRLREGALGASPRWNVELWIDGALFEEAGFDDRLPAREHATNLADEFAGTVILAGPDGIVSKKRGRPGESETAPATARMLTIVDAPAAGQTSAKAKGARQ